MPFLRFCVPLVFSALPLSSADGITATPRRLACALAGGSVNDWATYAGCLATECEDATRADFANVTDCLALQSVCSFDFSTVDNTFPSNTVFVSDVCPSTCGACHMESTTPAASSCSLGGSDLASWGTYAACLRAECEDATSVAFANITDCPTLQNLCAVDFNTVDSSFPAGAMNVTSVCPSTCGACQMNSTTPAVSSCSLGGSDIASWGTYAACLRAECEDATSVAFANITDCPTLQNWCAVDFNTVDSSFPAGAMNVTSVCPSTCGACQMDSTTPAVSSCGLGGSDIASWGTYAACLRAECEDATSAAFANITDCPTLRNLCAVDFNTVDSSFPAGAMNVTSVCPSTCGACQMDSTTPAASSCGLGGSDIASWGTYAACLRAECEDATSVAFANITDCPTLQNLCAVDFNTVDSSFPAGAMNVTSVCPSTCGACGGVSTSEPAESPSTGCVAGSFDEEAINAFTACLVDECADAAAEDMLNLISCPQIVEMSPDCSLDLHSVSALVPENLFVWELCPRTCDRCATPPPPTCTLDGADVAGWVSYAECLADVCADAVESDFDNTTDCVTLLAASPNCSLDLSLAVPGLQSGVYVHHACPMSCNRCDTKAPTAAPGSKSTLLPSATMTPTPFVCPLPGSEGDNAFFMQCLMDECVDAPSSLFEGLTDCHGLLYQSPDCSMDLAYLGDPRLFAGTHVSSYCPALCGTCSQVDDSTTQGAAGLFVGTATGGHTFTVNNAIGFCDLQSNVNAYLASIAVLYATPGAGMRAELRQCSVLDTSGNVLRRRLAGESVAMQYEVTITSSDYDAVANTMQDVPRRSNDTATFAQVFEQKLAQTTGSSQGLVVTGASLTSVVIPETGASTPAPQLDEVSGASRVLVLARAWLSIVVFVVLVSTNGTGSLLRRGPFVAMPATA